MYSQTNQINSMTTLRLMLEFDRLQRRTSLTTVERKRKKDIHHELTYRNERK